MATSLWDCTRGRQFPGIVILDRVRVRLQEWFVAVPEYSVEAFHIALAICVVDCQLSQLRRERINQ